MGIPLLKITNPLVKAVFVKNNINLCRSKRTFLRFLMIYLINYMKQHQNKGGFNLNKDIGNCFLSNLPGPKGFAHSTTKRTIFPGMENRIDQYFASNIIDILDHNIGTAFMITRKIILLFMQKFLLLWSICQLNKSCREIDHMLLTPLHDDKQYEYTISTDDKGH